MKSLLTPITMSLLVVFMALLAAAEEPMKQLPTGRQMLPENAIAAVHPAGAQGTVEKVAVEGQKFSEAIRVAITEKCPNAWSAQIAIPGKGKLEKGDAVVVSMWVRTISAQSETGEAYVAGGAQRCRGPWEKPVWFSFSVPRQWRLIEFGQISQLGIPDGQVSFYMHLGQSIQTLEIADIKMVNLGQGIPKESLPYPRIKYQGMEKDAAWRKPAAERIEKIRKGDISVQVVDKGGKPVNDADVKVNMAKHAFPFGTCINASFLNGAWGKDNPNIEVYRREFLKLFNCAVLENGLKPRSWENPQHRQYAMNTLKWLRDHDIMTRGHVAVWPSERFLAPSWQKMISYKPGAPPKTKDELATISEADRETLRLAINQHVTDVLSATKGYCFQWDVMNEPYSSHTLMDIYGDKAMVEWFKQAKQANAGTRLCINDYGVVTDGVHAEHFMKTIKFLLDNGAPLEGIGEQGHYGQQPPAISKVLETYDMLGSFGLPVMCTEFDINTPDEQTQADYLRDYMTALFSHPSCGGFLMWGFWAGAHWRPEAAMLTRDWQQKPSYKAYCDLVFKQWWTNASGKTNAQGQFNVRGFLGNYEVTVSHAGKTKTAKLILSKTGAALKIQLD